MPVSKQENKHHFKDFPLLHFSDEQNDDWMLSDAVRGVQIFGGIGSGKSSGSGKTIALSYLKHGFGGIILTGKVDETETWLEYAKQTGRLKDILIFGENNSKYVKKYKKLKKLNSEEFKFNPLEYEMNRGGEGAGETDNIVNLFTSIIKMGNRISGDGGTSSEPFWDMALQRCIKSAVDLLKLAKLGFEKENPKVENKPFRISVDNIAKVIRESPIGKNQEIEFVKVMKSADGDLIKRSINKSYTIRCLFWASRYTSNSTPQYKRAYAVAKNYFLSDLATLSEKTRSSITEYFYAFANPFRSGLLADYFAQETSLYIVPEHTFEGKIIILDFPVKKYLQVGVYAQAIYKKVWQQAVERRESGEKLPVFMWVDEAQYFLNEDDMLFQTTARSARACTMMISQNISNYYATIGGSKAKEQVDSLLGNLATKIFHSNNDYVTNEWAANTIGKTFQEQRSRSYGQMQNISISRSLEYQVEPQEFTTLRNGGMQNDFKVEAILTVAGKKWSNQRNYLITHFKQNINHNEPI